MSGRLLASTGVLATVSAVVSLVLVPVPVAGQAQTAAADTWTPPGTPWGDPDLQGIWDFWTLTPLERPSELAGQEVWTDEEAAALEQIAERFRVNKFLNLTFLEPAGLQLTEDRRTSLIVDPPDGTLPPLTPEAQERLTAMLAARRRPPHGPEDRNVVERCIVGETNGAPLIPGSTLAGITFNHNVQLFQTPGYVVLLNEMNHDARIVPLDGRPHVRQDIRLWLGDSRGRWEGNTLVVDTTNFNDTLPGLPVVLRRWGWRGGSETHLVESFTRVDADTITYEFTVDDPMTFTRPWSAALPMRRTEGPVFEFACHEGNYGLAGMLSGARAEEARPTIEVNAVDVVDAGAPVRLEAVAAAQDGARVERVEFLVDGAVVGVDREAPYEVTWTAAGSGRHLVTATVYDSLGKVARSAPVTAFVGIRALVARSEDAAEELPDGLMVLDNFDLGLGGRLDDVGYLRFADIRIQVVGLRFTDIQIPRGTPIQEAYLQFQAAPLQRQRAEPTDLTLHAELAGDAVAFAEVRQNLSVRTRTSAPVTWSPEPWDVTAERSVRQRTPNLAALVHEVVNRPDWREGNALVLLISGSGRRVAMAYDDRSVFSPANAWVAPRLYIELAEPSPYLSGRVGLVSVPDGSVLVDVCDLGITGHLPRVIDGRSLTFDAAQRGEFDHSVGHGPIECMVVAGIE